MDDEEERLDFDPVVCRRIASMLQEACSPLLAEEVCGPSNKAGEAAEAAAGYPRIQALAEQAGGWREHAHSRQGWVDHVQAIILFLRAKARMAEIEARNMSTDDTLICLGEEVWSWEDGDGDTSWQVEGYGAKR